jgi:type IV pilus assembly protein PilN
VIRINLVAPERRAAGRKITFDPARQNTTICIGIALVTLLAIGWRMRQLAADDKRLDAAIVVAQRETTRLHAIIEQVRQYEQRRAALQQRVTLIEQLRAQQVGPVRMLDQVSLALPPDVWLIELKQTPAAGEVLIDGRSLALTGLSDFVANLEHSGYFDHSVEIVSSTTEVNGQDEIVRFQIKGTFTDPSAPAPPASAPGSAKAKS